MKNSLSFTKFFAILALFFTCAAKCGPEASSNPMPAQQEKANTIAEETATVSPQTQPQPETMSVKPNKGGSATPVVPKSPATPPSTKPASEKVPREIPIGAAPDQQDLDKVKAEQEKLRKKEEGKKN